MINNFAPVLVLTLNRNEHFQKCITSLSNCKYASKTDLYIALDYPFKEEHWLGYKKIKEYITKIEGFKSIVVIERERNFGVNKNFFEAVKLIFSKFDRFILSEDDNVFSPMFLSFVNRGLEIYDGREDIFSISGYNNPYKMPDWYNNDVYLRKSFSAWGCGIWKKKWEKIDWSIENFDYMFFKQKNQTELKSNYMIALSQLLRISKTKNITIDGFVFLHMLDQELNSIYPVKTRVRNIGHDGSGVNSVKGRNSHKFMNQKYYKGEAEAFFPPEIDTDLKLNKYILNLMKLPLKSRIALFIPTKIKKWLKNKIK